MSNARASVLGLRAVERLADTRFALAQRAGVYDASRLLLLSDVAGGGDRGERALSAVERQLQHTLLPASRSEPPSRMAHCFRAAKDEWVVVLKHVCERTLRRRGDGGKGDAADAAADARVACGLGILTLLFFLHPPSVRWIPMETSLASILLAEGSDGQSMLRRRQHALRLRLAMVDCILALCVARVRAQRYDQDATAAANRLPDHLEHVLKRTFVSLANRCSYQLDQEAVFGAAQQAQQQANIQASLGALDILKGALS